MYKKSVLDNGVRVITYEMPKMKSSAFGVWFGAGGRFETKENNGISHFLEHMCFKGSERFSGKRIKRIIEGAGGSLNGFTSEEFTCYLAKVLPKNLKEALAVICDMALRPLIDNKELEKERLVILEEIRMYRDQPQSYVYELLDALIWPDHPLGMSLTGTPETVGKITRADLTAYKNDFYSAANIVVSASGPVKHNDFLSAVKKELAKLPQKAPNKFLPFCPDFKRRSNIFYKDTEQTHIALGFPSLERGHPDRHALMLLHIILGANMSSRLFDELREKRGLAYEIGTYAKFLNDTGVFFVHAGVDNNKVIEVLEVIMRELARIKNSRVGAKEFGRAKDFYLGQLTFALEQTMEEMLYMGEQFISLGRVKTQEEIIRELNRVKIGDLERIAREVFREEKINLALIGPASDKDKADIEKTLRL